MSEIDTSPAAVEATIGWLRRREQTHHLPSMIADLLEALAARLAEAEREKDHLHAGLSSIVHFQSPLTRAQVREAANELLNNKPDYLGGDQSPLAALLTAANAEIARLREANATPDCVVKGQAEYRGMEFNDAADIVETLLARFPDRPPETVYNAFRMVFGDKGYNGVPDPFDPTKPGPTYKELWKAATELAVEDANERSAAFKRRDATISALRQALATAKEALQTAERTISEFVSDIEDGGSITFSREYVQRHRDARKFILSALAAIDTAEKDG